MAAVLSFGLAAPAFATQCPTDMAAIDAALAAGPDLSAQQLNTVQAIRAEAEVFHDSGNYGAAVAALAKAKAILGI
jgi:hypothetical protein